IFSFPNWTINRVPAEAVGAHNVQCPSETLDLLTTPRDRLYSACHAFIRHQLCDYDRRLNSGEDRETLRAEISRAACTYYRWLRLDRDPRPQLTANTKPDLLFTDFSKQLCDLRDRRQQLLVVRPKRSRQERREIDAEVKRLDSEIARLDKAFRH